MKKIKLLILAAVATGVTALAVRASVVGWTVQRPATKPQSIREGSARGPIRSGHYRTRYFIGGGLHRGK